MIKIKAKRKMINNKIDLKRIFYLIKETIEIKISGNKLFNTGK